ncbi:MAG: hypothetical protein RJB62_1076 [Pseudomonadota bacterium]|jgi:predicted lactoylglutathione lyase
MNPQISLVTLGVSDLARSTAFYERLGWRRSVRAAKGVSFFQLGSLALSLFPKEELAKDAGVAAEGGGFCGVSFAQNMASKEAVDRVLAEAVEAGAKLLKPGQDVFWGGYNGYFADPDGYLWEIAWNPGFTLLEDGSIRLPE